MASTIVRSSGISESLLGAFEMQVTNAWFSPVFEPLRGDDAVVVVLRIIQLHDTVLERGGPRTEQDCVIELVRLREKEAQANEVEKTDGKV